MFTSAQIWASCGPTPFFFPEAPCGGAGKGEVALLGPAGRRDGEIRPLPTGLEMSAADGCRPCSGNVAHSIFCGFRLPGTGSGCACPAPRAICSGPGQSVQPRPPRARQGVRRAKFHFYHLAKSEQHRDRRAPFGNCRRPQLVRGAVVLADASQQSLVAHGHRVLPACSQAQAAFGCWRCCLWPRSSVLGPSRCQARAPANELLDGVASAQVQISRAPPASAKLSLKGNQRSWLQKVCAEQHRAPGRVVATSWYC